ncbi:MAG: DUF3078 domain-containing protein [Rhizobacter sp.]|nr:DUF3078 domain-containing protein [Chlorobiales bacterium]
MKKLTPLFITFFIATTAFAQTPAQEDSLRALVLRGNTAVATRDTSWKFTGNTGLNFTQVGLSNWAGGGQSSIALIALFGGTATYSENNLTWGTSLDLGYGVAKLGDAPFRKSDDRITLISKLDVAFTPVLSYSVLFDFRTQFALGENYAVAPDSITGKFPKISNFMAPGYLLTALGLSYHPADYFTLFFSPLTARTIFVLDTDLSNAGAFGVDAGKQVKILPGLLLNAFFKKELFENITLQSRLNLFSAYETVASVVVSWESLLLLKVNRFVTVSLAADVFYDERVQVLRNDNTTGPATQFRNTLAVGFVYSF